jgi:hypothetical protein
LVFSRTGWWFGVWVGCLGFEGVWEGIRRCLTDSDFVTELDRLDAQLSGTLIQLQRGDEGK